MNNIDEMFSKYTIKDKLSDNFEERVYSKIKKKKRTNRITYMTISIFFIFSVFFTYFFVFQKTPESGYLAKKPIFKEEIPVIEDVVFASSDGRTSYTIEQVSYNEDDTDI